MARIMKPTDPILEQFLRILIYGEPGIGKSTFAMTAPNPLFIDCDGGVQRVSPVFRTDYVPVEKWADIIEIINDASVVNYESIIIDTAGKSLEFLSDVVIQEDYTMKLKSGGLTLQGYGSLFAKFKLFLHQIMLKKKHLILVAHNREYRIEDSIAFRPDVIGSSLGALLKEMDLVGYMRSRENVRTIGFTPMDQYYAKNSCKLPDIMKIPDLNKEKVKPLTEIIDKYKANQQEQESLVVRYKEILGEIDTFMSVIKSAETANEAVPFLESLEELWDTKAIARFHLREKVKTFGLIYNTVSKLFEDPKEKRKPKPETTEKPDDILAEMTADDPKDQD